MIQCRARQKDKKQAKNNKQTNSTPKYQQRAKIKSKGKTFLGGGEVENAKNRKFEFFNIKAKMHSDKPKINQNNI